MGIVSTIILSALGLVVTMAVAWLIAVRSGRSGWVDAIWSFAVGIFGAFAALVSVVQGDNDHRQWLVAILALAWSLRLGWHIVTRTIGDGRDDPRYAQLKQ